ncbi:GNAT family N-acetyltransferase [Streptomyces stramineus]
MLRPWSPAEVTAVLDDVRPAHWAADFPPRATGSSPDSSPAAEALGPYGQRQIIERDSGLVVGAIGLFWPPHEGALEFGYGVVPSRRGRGYAPEAARAVVEFALASAEVHTVHADVEFMNPASIRVLEKAGLRRWNSDATTARFRATAQEPTRS